MKYSEINKVLARCGKPATVFSTNNGYRCCENHMHSITGKYETRKPETEEFDGLNIKDCDYRLDGLGAMHMQQRYSRYAELYLSWVNDFISSEKFAEHYNLDHETALAIIDIGRDLHENRVRSNVS